MMTYRWAVPMVAGLAAAGTQEEVSILERIRDAIDLPTIIDSIRVHGGIPEEEVRVVIEDVMRRGVPATETHDLLEETDAAIREHGPIDNFGAFVQAQLAAGLRGRDLAQAIRAEHGRRGIGKGQRRGAGPAPGERAAERRGGGPPEGRGRRPDTTTARRGNRGGTPGAGS